MQGASRGVDWESPDNAERYAAYVAKHPLYDLTSKALVGDLQLRPGSVVMDLCCGTGATTRAVLASIDDVRVIALDYARAQLELAQRDVVDERVTFVHAAAERAHEVVDARCDAVICNAAVWQLKPPAVRAVATLLRDNGQFAFNLPAPFAPQALATLCAEDPGLTRFARRQVDTLEHAMLDEVRGDSAFVTSGPPPPRTGFIEHRYLEALAAEGIHVDRCAFQAVPLSPEAAFDWYLIPVFRSNVLRGASAEAGEQALRRAYARWKPRATEAFALWVNFLATKRPSAPSPRS